MNAIIKIDDNSKLDELQICLFENCCYWNKNNKLNNNLNKYKDFYIICLDNKLTITFTNFGIYRLFENKCIYYNSINEFLRIYKINKIYV